MIGCSEWKASPKNCCGLWFRPVNQHGMGRPPGDLRMLRRIILAYLACMFLGCLSTPNQAWPQQESPRPIRTLVEGESSISRAMIEALRRVYANQETRLEFTLNTGDPYDLRLIVSNGSGGATESCSGIECNGSVTINIYHTTVAALGSDGKLLFIDTYSDTAAKKINDEAAALVSKNINRLAGTLRKEAIAAAAREAASGSSEEPPKEAGVYQRDGSNWILLAESLSDGETRVGQFLLTVGLAPLREYDVYRGNSAKLQITQVKPEFYVRGFPVSETDLAILKLKKVDSRREIQSRSFSFIRGRSKPYEKNIHKLKVTRITDGLYKLIPAEELKEGEYALDLSLSDSTSGAYEFGISSKKK
jgi:hypothetical protein